MRYPTRHLLFLLLLLSCIGYYPAQGLKSSTAEPPLSSPDEYIERGTALWHKADYEGAISNYTKAIEMDEASVMSAGRVQIERLAKAYLNRGILKAALRNYDDAFADLSRAIQLRPEWDEPYLNRGLTLMGKKDYYGAIADYSQAIESNPKLARAYYHRSIARYDLNDFNGALDDSNMALEIDPNEAGAYGMRATLREKSHDFAGALADYNKGIELCSHCLDVYLSRGILLLYLGRDTEAERDFKKCLTLDPSRRPDLEQKIEEYKRLRNLRR